MAGVKGRSGGRREGAGRKLDIASHVKAAVTGFGGVETRQEPQAHGGSLTRNEAKTAVTSIDDPLVFLRAVWQGEIEANASQVKAAIAALPFTHKKLGEGGKKEQKEEAAEKALGNSFRPASAPKLKAVGGNG